MPIEILEDVCSDCDPNLNPNYCSLKEILKHLGMPENDIEKFKCIRDFIPEIKFLLKLDERIVEQYKCIEKFKIDESRRQNSDIGDTAKQLWVDLGYAAKFGEIYKPGMKCKELYEKVMAK